MANDALSKFAGALFSEATSKKLSSVKTYTAQMEKALAEEEKALQKKAERAVGTFETSSRYALGLTLARRKNELHTTLIQNRGRVFADVFAGVEENLRAFVKQEEYADYLLREHQPYAEAFREKGTECIGMEADLPILRKCFAGMDYTFIPSKEDFIGGFILRNQASRLYADCTLMQKLEEQKEKFYYDSGLIIE